MLDVADSVCGLAADAVAYAKFAVDGDQVLGDVGAGCHPVVFDAGGLVALGLREVTTLCQFVDDGRAVGELLAYVRAGGTVAPRDAPAR